jgi:hypothetical protein
MKYCSVSDLIFNMLLYISNVLKRYMDVSPFFEVFAEKKVRFYELTS